MCENEKNDLMLNLIEDLKLDNKKKELSEVVFPNKFNTELVKRNLVIIKALEKQHVNFTDVACDCDYCKAKASRLEHEKLKRQNIIDAQNNIKKLSELADGFCAILSTQGEDIENIKKAIRVLTDTESQIVRQIDLIETNYNVLDSIKEI